MGYTLFSSDGGLLVKEISESTCWFSFVLQTFNTSYIPACRQVLVMVKVCTVFSLFSNENLLWIRNNLCERHTKYVFSFTQHFFMLFNQFMKSSFVNLYSRLRFRASTAVSD